MGFLRLIFFVLLAASIASCVMDRSQAKARAGQPDQDAIEAWAQLQELFPSEAAAPQIKPFLRQSAYAVSPDSIFNKPLAGEAVISLLRIRRMDLEIQRAAGADREDRRWEVLNEMDYLTGREKQWMSIEPDAEKYPGLKIDQEIARGIVVTGGHQHESNEYLARRGTVRYESKIDFGSGTSHEPFQIDEVKNNNRNFQNIYLSRSPIFSSEKARDREFVVLIKPEGATSVRYQYFSDAQGAYSAIESTLSIFQAYEEKKSQPNLMSRVTGILFLAMISVGILIVVVANIMNGGGYGGGGGGYDCRNNSITPYVPGSMGQGRHGVGAGSVGRGATGAGYY
ncbi:MAG: hypothetical protein AAGH88_11100 [Planctomycetota bacterium]